MSDRFARWLGAAVVLGALVAAAAWLARTRSLEGPIASTGPAHAVRFEAEEEPEAEPTSALADERSARVEAAAPEPAVAGSPAGRRLHGRVTEVDGTPIRIGNVQVEGARGDVRHAPIQGSYAVEGLPAGSFSVHFELPGYLRERRSADLTKQPAVQLDVVLKRSWRVLVRASTDTGRPLRSAISQPNAPFSLSGLHVRAVPSVRHLGNGGPPETLEPTLRADRAGFPAALLREVPDVLMQLDTEASFPMTLSLLGEGRLLASETLDQPVPVVLFVVPYNQIASTLGNLRLRALDARSGSPVRGARAELVHRQSYRLELYGTDDRGVLERKGLEAGPYKLILSNKDVGIASLTFEVRPRELVDLSDVQLTAFTWIEGRIEGGPAAGFGGEICIYPWDPAAPDEPLLEAQIRKATPAPPEKTHFRVQDLMPGPYVAWVSGDGQHGRWGSSAVFVDAFTPVRNLVIRLEPVRPVRIELAGAGTRELEASILDAGGLPVRRRQVGSRGKLAMRLTDGRYRVRLHEGGRSWNGPEFVVAGTWVDVRVEL